MPILRSHRVTIELESELPAGKRPVHANRKPTPPYTLNSITPLPEARRFPTLPFYSTTSELAKTRQ
jgi:hypothetical protein